MIREPNPNGDGYLALQLVDRLLRYLIERDIVDNIEISAWVEEIQTEIEGAPKTNLTRAALVSLSRSRIGA